MDLIRRFWIIAVTSGFLIGVAIGTFFPALEIGAFFLVIAFAFIIYAIFFIKEFGPKGIVVLISVCMIFCSLGIWRFASSTLSRDLSLQAKVGQNIDIKGRVVQEPKEKDSYRQYVVKTDSGSELLVRATMFPEYYFGDVLEVSGRLDAPQNFETSGGQTFDYISYLSKEGISYIVSFAKVEKVGEWNAPVRKTLFAIKRKFVSSYEKVISYPESALLGGILLGIDDSMGKSLSDAFRMVGIIHIVVLSGYNITIVAESVEKSLRFLSRRKALSISVLGIIIFVTMVGFSPSVVRAAIMAIIAISAKFLRRNYNVARALLLAAAVMVALNPRVLFYDLGFQLSFLATIAVIWLSPKVIPHMRFVPDKLGLRDIAGTTVATQLFVLPLLIYSSGIVSLSGFLVNLIVLPVVPTIMLMGFVTGVLGFVHTTLAFIPGIVTQYLLTYVVWIAEHVSKLPGSFISISSVPAFVPFCAYILFGSYVIYRKAKAHRSAPLEKKASMSI